MTASGEINQLLNGSRQKRTVANSIVQTVKKNHILFYLLFKGRIVKNMILYCIIFRMEHCVWMEQQGFS